MYLSPDDAKSDVILAAAAALFGGLAFEIVARLPLYPRQGALADALGLLWIAALTGLVPWLLSRYRRDGLAAFGLQARPTAIALGSVLALPIVLGSALQVLLAGGRPAVALGGPFTVIGSGSGPSAPGISLPVLITAQIAVLSVGAVLLVSFLAIRSRHAFPRSPDVSLTESLRSFGMGAAGLALVVGLVRSIGVPSTLPVLINVATLVAVILLVDRHVPARLTVPRATVLAPGTIVILLHIFGSGGFFRGDLVTALYHGGLGAGIAVVVSILVQISSKAWSIVPLLTAVYWWQSLLSPLP